MESVEHAHGDVQPPQIRCQVVDARYDTHAIACPDDTQRPFTDAFGRRRLGSGPSGGSVAVPESHEDLLGDDATGLPRAHADQAFVRVEQAEAGVLFCLRAGDRLDLLSANDGRDFRLVQDHGGDAAQAGVYRQKQLCQLSRPGCGSGSDYVEIVGPVHAERAAGRPRQGPQIRTAAELLAKVAGQGSDVGSRTALDLHDGHRPRGIGAVPIDQIEAVRSSRPAAPVRAGRLRAPAGKRGGRRPSWH